MSERQAQGGGRPGIGRRRVLAGLAGGAGAALLAPYARAAPAWRVPYGCAVRVPLLGTDALYADAIRRHCTWITPESAVKWDAIRPDRATFDYSAADAYVGFARDNGLTPRGHTLVWAGALPDWTKTILAGEARALMVEHIRRTVLRYTGTIASWDVVNEPIAEKDDGPDGLRSSIWLERLGPDYIEIALRAAAEADPLARLVVNEYGIEGADRQSRTKRERLLVLLTDLRKRGVPLHALGLQGHLYGHRPIDVAGFGDFLKAVRALGLSLIVTELDVLDDRLPADIDARDAMVAERADEFLGVVFAGGPPEAVLTWGITDRYTWVPMYFSRPDGLPNRPLPLDAAYAEKPLYGVIAHRCGSP